jgi:hypothetical protein
MLKIASQDAADDLDDLENSNETGINGNICTDIYVFI